MSQEHCDDHDGALTAALAEIIAHLKSTPYSGAAEGIDPGLRGSADDFVARLARHLEHEEETLFPSILKAAPGRKADVDRLLEEHQLLRVYASELAHRIKARDAEGAVEVSRDFLAALFDHIDRERHLSAPGPLLRPATKS